MSTLGRRRPQPLTSKDSRYGGSGGRQVRNHVPAEVVHANAGTWLPLGHVIITRSKVASRRNRATCMSGRDTSHVYLAARCDCLDRLRE